MPPIRIRPLNEDSNCLFKTNSHYQRITSLQLLTQKQMDGSVVHKCLRMSHHKSSLSPAIPLGKSSPISLSRPLTNTPRNIRPETTKSAATTGPVLPTSPVYAKSLCPTHRIRQ